MDYDARIFGLLFLFVLLIDLPMVVFIFKPYFWNNVLNGIQNSKENDNKINTIIGFILTYLLIPLGLFLFVFQLINKDNWLLSCLLFGFLWGIITYGIFDFTNLVLFKKYPLWLAFFDTIWGGIMSAVVLTITYAVYNKKLF